MEAAVIDDGGPKTRQDLISSIGDQLVEFSHLRDRAEQHMVMRGQEPGEIIVCLGAGRCLFPTTKKSGRICPFCLRVPDKHMTDAEVAEITRRFVVGN